MTVARNQGWPPTAVRAVYEKDARASRMVMIVTSWPARFTEPWRSSTLEHLRVVIIAPCSPTRMGVIWAP